MFLYITPNRLQKLLTLPAENEEPPCADNIVHKSHPTMLGDRTYTKLKTQSEHQIDSGGSITLMYVQMYISMVSWDLVIC